MKFPPREVKRARIEIIPMIDTIFFLLVFFMITAFLWCRCRPTAWISLPARLPH